MKKITFFLGILILPLISFGQLNQNEFLTTIEWINQNPSQSNDEVFVSKSADLIKFQIFNYPSFPINTSGTSELSREWKGHKYERYFLIVYSFNQLYYKIENKKFDKLEAYLFSMNQLLKSYSNLIEESPEFKIGIFDEYAKLSQKDLKKRIKKLI
ncbi:MAG: hypothetical protein AAGF96_10825 [Bacteroidota bacterium]